MVYRFDVWDRFDSGRYWWMHAMLGLWLVFAMMLFVVEPLFLHRHWAAAARNDQSGRAFARIQRLHEIFCVLSLVVVFAAAGGAHGLF
jgi:mannose/fructose/N-acetylgalactosamine-specific phosphotransferase system component IIC